MKEGSSIQFEEEGNEGDYLIAEMNEGNLVITCDEYDGVPSIIYLSATQAEQLADFIRNELNE